MKLKHKITGLTMGLLVTTMITIILMSMFVIDTWIKENIHSRLQDVATTISITPLVQNELEKGSSEKLVIQNYVEKIRLKTDVYFITVIDMKGIRYSHPLPDKIGKQFKGSDHYRAIWHGERYVSEGEGHLGRTIRAFEPVYKDGVRVGAVCVGAYKGDVQQEVKEYILALTPIFILSIFMVLIGSALLSNNIKNAIFGFEPEEIALSLREKEAIINNMIEGLIAVDRKGQISLINSSAKDILQIRNENEIDKEIIQNLLETIYRRSRIINHEIKLKNNIVIMANFYTLIGENGEILGAITTFQDLTIVNNMAEELTGVKELTWNLRAQNHEFMNKLHTISGLIQLEEYDKAVEYIYETSVKRGLITDNLKGIREAALQGLIFSKYNKADEAKIKFELDENSKLDKLTSYIIPQELLTIVGNLLENSIEELRGKENGWISLSIIQEEKIVIEVKNNGTQINSELKDKIFNMGYSTKGENRGFGLYNIIKIVNNCNGDLELTSNDITVWKITI
ncbi:MAG: ATP-binding protein [Clostridium sp.]